MTVPTTENPPSFLEVVSDFSKNVVTLSIGLLGLTVTFASGLIGKAPAAWATKLALYATWVLALATIACGVAAQAFIARHLKQGGSEAAVARCANSAFFLLLSSAVAFTCYGILVVMGLKVLDSSAIVEKAMAGMPGLTGQKDTRWELKRLKADPATDSYDVVLYNRRSSDSFLLTLDANGKITKVEKVDPSSPLTSTSPAAPPPKSSR